MTVICVSGDLPYLVERGPGYIFKWYLNRDYYHWSHFTQGKPAQRGEIKGRVPGLVCRGAILGEVVCLLPEARPGPMDRHGVSYRQWSPPPRVQMEFWGRLVWSVGLECQHGSPLHWARCLGIMSPPAPLVTLPPYPVNPDL